MPLPRVAAAPLLAVLAALAVGLPACGTDEKEEIREALDGLAQSTERKDYKRLCSDVLSERLRDQIRSVGLACEAALELGLKSVQKPRLTVDRIRIKDDTHAVARVRTTAANQPPSTDEVELVKQGGRWRIDSLAGAGPPSPPPMP